eukprot:TRINITY_DN482_c0_g1_i1.p1 TRINITY_DN482_c0_g1~~TRINITY_DN482_c0_g1_i1.p1  ORF type:complete len:263 (+),score=63.39 TRINITY_DN482_c0_g1_i1:105-893(+)
MKAGSAILVCLLAFICSVSAHGRLSSPPYRGVFQPSPPWYSYMDEAPVKDASGANSPMVKDFICRSNQVMPQANWTTITAGSTLTIQMNFQAAHVGDCFMYLTYDADKPEDEMRWFKIWQQYECKDNNRVDVPVKIPDYIPSTSHAILRWEWYALHVFPTIEFYAQCVDVKVNGNANGVMGTPMFNIPGHLPTAQSSNGTNNYRNPYSNPVQTWFTGPALAVAGGPYTPLPPATGNSTVGSPAASTVLSVSLLVASIVGCLL